MYQHLSRPMIALIVRLLAVAVAGLSAPAMAVGEPFLIVQITVDQLRGDMLERLRPSLGSSGFRRLMTEGRWYRNANYGTANTFTASGHAVLVTGADTAQHGMVANEWFDRTSGRIVHSASDPRYPIVGEPPRDSIGFSPTNLSATTIADEIVEARPGARAFAVAGKDRSAVIPAGRLGKAYWFSESSGRFVTSRFYMEALPAWVSSWNARRSAFKWRGTNWSPISLRGSPSRTSRHARPNKVLGASFPHSLQADTDAAYLGALKNSPFLDELTLDFAQELVMRENLGRGSSTDYLSVSLSATDYIGHAFGPNSLEHQDQLLRLDRDIAGFISFLERRVGRRNILLVLAADHGVDDIPEDRAEQHFNAGRFYPDQLLERMNAFLRLKLGLKDDVIRAFVPPGFYLDARKIRDGGLDEYQVQQVLADELRLAPGVAAAFTRYDLVVGKTPDTAFGRRVARAFHPTRSGDVVIVQQPFWYLYPDADAFAAMHGSPYSYDTFVPVIFWGEKVQRGEVTTPIEPASIAVTIARRLRIKAPSGTSTGPLTDVFSEH